MKNEMYRLTDEELLEELQKRFVQNKQSIEELQILTKQLKEVNEKLKESEELKSHFISNITNEIINPFASILGLSKHIISLGAGKSQHIEKMAQLIYKEAFCLDFQLKNIFAAAEIESGEFYPDISMVDVRQVIQSVVEYFKEEAESKQITVHYEFEINDEFGNNFHFKTDPEKLKLLIINLLDNAIKFSNKNGNIWIDSRIEQGDLKIMIKDQGIGISPENHKIIFDRFKRVDSGINSITRGHGLGLSIVKAILDVLEGVVELKSELTKGAQFNITIPEVSAKTDVSDFATDGNEIFFGEDEIF